ncbi:MAG: hypothetical protein IJX78_05860 [Bacilli bacterium]|nr:hypothetical protein [Bacilli bacterium]
MIQCEGNTEKRNSKGRLNTLRYAGYFLQEEWFEWDELWLGRIGTSKTKINKYNLPEYIELFNSLDKFYVYS